MDIEAQIRLIRKQYADEVSGLITEIDPRDNMCSPGRQEHYFSVGRNALFNIVTSMIASDVGDIRKFLDFPSGFGRVTRHVRAAFPQATIHVGDAWGDAREYSAKTFDATIIEANRDFSARSDERYDVIFCGSLLTHLPSDLSHKLLDFLIDHLEIGGIAIVTACGKKNLDHEAKHFNAPVFETPEKLNALTQAYYRGEYAYCDYPGNENYGRSFTPVSWFHEYAAPRDNLVITRFAERSWDDNQDICTFKRIA